jgi:hypothetical protein
LPLAPYPHKRVFENIAIGLRLRGYPKEKIKMKVPYFTGALGSTDIARIHWEPMAIAAAIAGAAPLAAISEQLFAPNGPRGSSIPYIMGPNSSL